VINKLILSAASSSATSAVLTPSVSNTNQTPQDAALKIAQCQASTTVATNIFITAADAMAEAQIDPVIQQNQANLESLINQSVNGGNPQPANPQVSAASQVAAQQALQAAFQPAIDAEKTRIATLQNGLQQIEASAEIQAEAISSSSYRQCLSR
jgi:hypothetical protein